MIPTELRLRPDKTTLTVVWPEFTAELSAEYLRVESPSAEVKGHRPEQAMLVPGKQGLTITQLEPVGAYAVKIHFADGHRTGLYTWAYLHELAEHYPTRWAAYVDALAARGLSRTHAAPPVKRHGL
jgi:DUF971 family protein